MRMTGNLAGLGVVSEMYRRVANGEAPLRTKLIPAGSSAAAQPVAAPAVPVAAAQPVAAPAVPTQATAAVTATPAATQRGTGLTTFPRPTTGITADHLRPSPGAVAPATIRPGPGATSGTASGAASYGPTTYYGAPEGGEAVATATEKKSGGWLPIGLLLWALFGT